MADDNIRIDIKYGHLLKKYCTIRTRLEDDLLQKELKGYKQYAERVAYKLIPEIW